MNIDDWVKIAGLFMGFLVALGGLVKYYHGQIDKLKDTVSDVKSELYKELDKVKADYVKSVDLNLHINRIESGVKEVHKRLDDLFNILIERK